MARRGRGLALAGPSLADAGRRLRRTDFTGIAARFGTPGDFERLLSALHARGMYLILWDSSPKAGFTAGEPWLPLNPDPPVRNVAALTADPRSILTLHRRLIALRRERSALHRGRFVLVGSKGDVIDFKRRHGPARLLVGLNLGHRAQRTALPADAAGARLLLSTALDRESEEAAAGVDLRPSEGVVMELRQA
jgi:glycosidase